MRIRFYETDSIFKRPEVMKRLRFLTNGGWGRHPEGSGMLENLEARKNGWIILAWDQGEIVGWSYLWKRRHDDNLQIGVYVAPKHRRTGIGSKLAKKAKEFADETDRTILSQGWNKAGLSFYNKNKIQYTSDWNY